MTTQTVSNPPTPADIERYSQNLQATDAFVNDPVAEDVSLPGGGSAPNLQKLGVLGATAAATATEQADIATAAAAAAVNGVIINGIYATTALGVDTAVKNTATIVAPGAGGTNGSGFALALPAPATGGTQAVGNFTVAGGVVTAVNITTPGSNYFRDGGVLQLDAAAFAAAAFPAGTPPVVTLKLGGGVLFGRGFGIAAGTANTLLWQNVAGVATAILDSSGAQAILPGNATIASLQANIIANASAVTAETARATAAETLINAVLSWLGVSVTRISSRSQATWRVKDPTGRWSIWINKAGQFCIGATENILGILLGLKSKVDLAIKPINTRSGYMLQLGKDASGRVPLGLNLAGHLMYHDVDVHSVLDPVAAAAKQLYVTPAKSLAMIGDSLTEGAGSTGGQTFMVQLLALFAAAGDTRTGYASGFGGSSATNILARFGAAPGLVTFPTGASGFAEIPASGAVNVTITNNPLNYPGDPSQAKSMTGWVAGIYGTLNRASINSGGQYSFTRSVAGGIVKIDTATPFIPDLGGREFWTYICWIATNDLISGAVSATVLLSYIDAYMGHQPTAEQRGIVMMPLWDMDAANSATCAGIYATLLGLVKAKYPDRYIDTLAVLQRANDGSANDLADVAAGLVPRSLQAADRTHLLNAGYGALAAEAFRILKTVKGW